MKEQTIGFVIGVLVLSALLYMGVKCYEAGQQAAPKPQVYVDMPPDGMLMVTVEGDMSLRTTWDEKNSCLWMYNAEEKDWIPLAGGKCPK